MLPIRELEYLKAAKDGNIQVINDLLTKKYLDKNFANENGDTALILAAENGHFEIVKELIPFVEINKENNKQDTALILASFYGHFDIVDILTKSKKIRPNLVDSNGKSALEYAVITNNIDIVRLLIYTDYSRCSICTKGALIEAAGRGNEEILAEIVDYEENNKKTSSINAAFVSACKYGNESIVSFLLSKVTDINCIDFIGNTGLMYALKRGDIKIIEMILSYKKNIANAYSSKLSKGNNIKINKKNASGCTAFLVAVISNNIGVVKILLELSSNNDLIVDLSTEDINGNNAIIHSIDLGNVEMLEMLLELSYISTSRSMKINLNKANKYGITPLILACKSSNPSMVDTLLYRSDLSVDINFADSNGNTPLMWAIKTMNNVIIRMLLEYEYCHIDINLKNKKGITAFMLAFKYDSNIAKEFLGYNVDLGITDSNGSTAAMYAAFYGSKEILQILLSKAEVNPNEQNNYGHTALIFASKSGSIQCVKELLYHQDIDVNLVAGNKKAIDYALNNGHSEIVSELSMKTIDYTSIKGDSENIYELDRKAVASTAKDFSERQVGVVSSEFKSPCKRMRVKTENEDLDEKSDYKSKVELFKR